MIDCVTYINIEKCYTAFKKLKVEKHTGWKNYIQPLTNKAVEQLFY